MEPSLIKLTQYSHGAGCGCKISPVILDKILHSALTVPPDPRLLVGNDKRDDAAVLDLGNGSALISTTDFFMPIVDNAYDFGRIASANAISDVYAMGGRPVLAIAIELDVALRAVVLHLGVPRDHLARREDRLDALRGGLRGHAQKRRQSRQQQQPGHKGSPVIQPLRQSVCSGSVRVNRDHVHDGTGNQQVDKWDVGNVPKRKQPLVGGVLRHTDD